MIPWTDRDGNVQHINPDDVVSYEDSAYFAESSTIFPGVEQATILKTGEAFDSQGRPNLLGRNLVLVDFQWMERSDYGPWFLLNVVTAEGQYSIPARGQAVNEFVEKQTGTELATGRKIADPQLPVQFRILYAKDAGNFEGYFYTAGNAIPVEGEEVEETDRDGNVQHINPDDVVSYPADALPW